ncbi:copper amine oxidase N-terminal domain-containing protein [Intestinimonas sp. MSJ-38]|uniref:copper amine oxidase N-terminal domain-containing protein n=1 Tax=Intestinimonas sp. MSJ-38 TaxID=2841532 RepID=UPI001C1254EA|nr:copper amine oxidase N-terminal domain-containing protein [Intestinimonas sp. MSJ-38]MBU5433941.1 copper amine oxidase N-terminal domain-containing protein [Intestinimonas sp. MSJ-38]
MKLRRDVAGFAVGLLCGGVIFGGVGIASGVIATPLTESSQKVTLDGQAVSLEGYNINGSNYFKLRDLGKAMDFGVTWNNDSRTVEIDSNAGYVEEEKPAIPGAVKIPAGDASWCPPVGTVIDLGNGQTMTVTKAKDPEPELTVPANASSFWQDELPEPKVIVYEETGAVLIRNLHETRRMQYSLFEVAEPGTKIYLGMEDARPGEPSVEWPWHEGMLQQMYLSGPRSKVWVEAWDCYKNGRYLYTEYDAK